MTRQEFMSKLRSGLSGMPAATISDICADYEAHFADAEAAGRSESDVAAALGDPVRLARELRAEAGLKAWQETRSPSTAATAVFAVLGLGALDIIFILPILMGVAGTLFGFFMAAIGMLVAGGALLVIGPFVDGVSIAGVMFAGLGLMAAAASLGAFLTLLTGWFINLLVWYGRLHYRLLKPAIES